MTEPAFLHDTRSSYDAVAAAYAEQFKDELAHQPFERALLTAFAEQVTGKVVDVGCGPGEVTAYLGGLGLDVRGVDLSAEMVAVASRAHPGLRFEQGTMTALDLPDGALGGIVAWYSTIHLPGSLLPEVFAEFRRVLEPGGRVVLAFQLFDADGRRESAFGREISLAFYRRGLDEVERALAGAGLETVLRAVREAEGQEKVARGYLMARSVQPSACGIRPMARSVQSF